MYSHTPYSRRYIAIPYFTLAFLIGFLGWQICVGFGVSFRSDPTALSRLFAKTLIWGSVIYALAAMGLLIAIAWTVSTRLGFSRHRKKQQMKICLYLFIAGIGLSLLGIAIDLTNAPPLDILYTPLLNADLDT